MAGILQGAYAGYGTLLPISSHYKSHKRVTLIGDQIYQEGGSTYLKNTNVYDFAVSYLSPENRFVWV